MHPLNSCHPTCERNNCVRKFSVIKFTSEHTELEPVSQLIILMEEIIRLFAVE